MFLHAQAFGTFLSRRPHPVNTPSGKRKTEPHKYLCVFSQSRTTAPFVTDYLLNSAHIPAPLLNTHPPPAPAPECLCACVREVVCLSITAVTASSAHSPACNVGEWDSAETEALSCHNERLEGRSDPSAGESERGDGRMDEDSSGREVGRGDARTDGHRRAGTRQGQWWGKK